MTTFIILILFNYNRVFGSSAVNGVRRMLVQKQLSLEEKENKKSKTFGYICYYINRNVLNED